MKVFVSADIEGVAGILTFEEASRHSPGAYGPFAAQMNAEVAAACEGAVAAGATEILVKDAHAGANNLRAADLPRETRLIRGWSGHPYGMVQGLDASFDAALFVGYHARAGSGGNPLAHSFSSRRVYEMRVNGTPASEYLVHAWAAALCDVPVVLVTGDRALCDEVEAFNPAVTTVATKWGEGPSQTSLHPKESVDAVRAGAERSLQGDPTAARVTPPEHTVLEVEFKEASHAYAKSHYPGAALVTPHTIRFESDDYYEVLRALMFVV